MSRVMVEVAGDATGVKVAAAESVKAINKIGLSAEESAKLTVSATVKQRESLAALASEYTKIGMAAKAGSAEQVAATELAAKANKRLGASMALLRAESEKTRGSMISMNKLMTGAFGIAIAAIGIHKLTDAAMDFNNEMKLVHTQAGATTGEMDRMSKAIKRLAISVGTGPEELAKGLYHVESAGLRGAKALEVLTTAAKGAKVGHADLEDVTNALVAAQKSGIDGVQNMNQAMGALNAIVGVGNMRMGDLAEALSTGILPSARAVGLGLHDVGGALAVMTDSGVPAVAAATRLRMTLMQMAAPTNAAQKALKSIGLSSTELGETMRTKGLVPALEILKKHLEESGATATQQTQIISKAFGGGRTSSTIITLLQQLDNVKTKVSEIDKGGSRFGASWKATQESSAFATAKFRAALSVLAIELGSTLLPIVTKVANAIADWIDHAQKTGQLKSIVDNVTAAVKLTFDAIGKLLGITNTVAQAMGGWKNVIIGVGIAFAAWKLGELVMSLAAVGKAVLLLTTNFKAIGTTMKVQKGEVIGANVAMEASTVASATAMKAALISTGFGALAVAAGLAAAYVITHWDKVKGWAREFAHGMIGTLGGMWTIIKGMAELGVYGLLVAFEGLTRGASAALGWIPGIGPKIRHAMDSATGFIEGFRKDGVANLGRGGAQMSDAWANAFVAGVQRGVIKANETIADFNKQGGPDPGDITGTDVRIPKKVPKGALYPLGASGTVIGTPGQGTHSFTSGPNNWESDNAVDISATVGTAVIAVEAGTIGNAIGSLGSSDPKMAGLRLHLVGNSGVEYYYAHLSKIIVRAGQKVSKGQTLGYSGSANGVAHLHFATDSGNPMTIIGSAAVISGAENDTSTTGTYDPNADDKKKKKKGPAAPTAITIEAVKKDFTQLGQALRLSANDLPKVLSDPIAALKVRIADLLSAAHPTSKQLADARKLLSEAHSELKNALAFDDVVDATNISIKKIKKVWNDGVIPTGALSDLKKQVVAFSQLQRDFARGGVTDAELAIIKKKGKALQDTIANALKFDQLGQAAQVSIRGLNKMIRDGFLTPSDVAATRQLIVGYNKALREAWADGAFSKADEKAMAERAKGIVKVLAGFNKDLEAQGEELRKATADMQSTIVGAAAGIGFNLSKIYTPADIRELDARFKNLTASLSKRMSASELKNVTAGLDDVNVQMKSAFDQMQKEVDDGKAQVAAAWTAFGTEIADVFQKKVANKFSDGLDALAASFDSGELAQAIIEDTDALTAAIAGYVAKSTDEAGNAIETLVAPDPAIVQLVNDQLVMWQEYYKDLQTGAFDAAKLLQGSIIANEAKIRAALAGLTGDQLTASQAVVDAGGKLVGDLKTQGDAAVAQVKNTWDTVGQEAITRINQVVSDSQIALDKGSITLPQALQNIKDELIKEGMDPADADKLIHDPLAASLGKAVEAVTLATNMLIIAIDNIAVAMGIETPELKKAADAARDAISDPIEQAATRVESAADRIRNAIKYLTDPAIIAAAGAAADAASAPATAAATSVHTAGFAQGGEVFKKQLAWVGEAGHEFIVPANKIPPSLRSTLQPLLRGIIAGKISPVGASSPIMPSYGSGGAYRDSSGGDTIIINIPNYVGDKRDLTNVVRTEIQRTINRNRR